MLRIVTVIGARPQFIKAAVVSRALAAHDEIQETIIHTGQHYDAKMSEIFFSQLQIPTPKYNLEIGSGTHAEQSARIMMGLEPLMPPSIYDMMLVYGDTNSTLAAALVAAKLQIPLIHIEAGMRSFDRTMPEEVNRVVCDVLSDILFCTSEEPATNLRREGIVSDKIHIVGDVMRDAVKLFAPHAQLPHELKKWIGEDPYLLVTAHRAENTKNREQVELLLEILVELSSQYKIVFPIHPRTQALCTTEMKRDIPAARIKLCEPLGYFEMLAVCRGASMVMTDSGGLQKEAYYLGKRGVVLRDRTEWKELVAQRWLTLAPLTSKQQVIAAVAAAQASSPEESESPLYGEGDAADAIAKILLAAHERSSRGGV